MGQSICALVILPETTLGFWGRCVLLVQNVINHAISCSDMNINIHCFPCLCDVSRVYPMNSADSHYCLLCIQGCVAKKNPCEKCLFLLEPNHNKEHANSRHHKGLYECLFQHRLLNSCRKTRFNNHLGNFEGFVSKEICGIFIKTCGLVDGGTSFTVFTVWTTVTKMHLVHIFNTVIIEFYFSIYLWLYFNGLVKKEWNKTEMLSIKREKLYYVSHTKVKHTFLHSPLHFPKSKTLSYLEHTCMKRKGF